MNTNPKLQDTLEVFLEELESLKHELKKSKETLPIIEDRVREIKDSKIKIDVSALKYIQTHFYNNIVEKTNNFNSVLDRHLENTKKTLAHQKNDRKSFYLFSFLNFFISIIAVYFGISYYKDYNRANEQLQHKEKQLNTFKTYIYDTKQVERFKKWHEKQ